MRLYLRFSQSTIDQLNDVVAEADEASKETVTPRSWLINQVNTLAGIYAKPWRQLEATGHYTVGTSPPPIAKPVAIALADLRDLKFAEIEGSYELFLGERTVLRLERACAITAAANKALGREGQQQWSTPNEWLESYLVEQIAQARAVLDMKEMAEEQRAAETAEMLSAQRAKRREELGLSSEAPKAGA
ncbi:MAG TPA: hypothetical protein VMG99_08705 [Thermoplasmata archaeon]|nr:hypothetical protein [Thermoplasmata archaeon]